MKKLIIFICNGNIERSVIAAECLRNILKEKDLDSTFFVDSYGIQGTCDTQKPNHKHLSEYPEEWSVAEPCLTELGIDISNHTYQTISDEIMEKASIVIAMDEKVYSTAQNSLLGQFPSHIKKVHRFAELADNDIDIKDLVGSGSKELHTELIKEIYSTVEKKYKEILAWVE